MVVEVVVEIKQRVKTFSHALKPLLYISPSPAQATPWLLALCLAPVKSDISGMTTSLLLLDFGRDADIQPCWYSQLDWLLPMNIGIWAIYFCGGLSLKIKFMGPWEIQWLTDFDSDLDLWVEKRYSCICPLSSQCMRTLWWLGTFICSDLRTNSSWTLFQMHPSWLISYVHYSKKVATLLLFKMAWILRIRIEAMYIFSPLHLPDILYLMFGWTMSIKFQRLSKFLTMLCWESPQMQNLPRFFRIMWKIIYFLVILNFPLGFYE